MKTFVALLVAGLVAIVNAEVPVDINLDLNTTTRALEADAEAAGKVSPGDVSSVVVNSINIGSSIAGAISAAGKKECHQLACWIASPTYGCQFAAANWVQRELTRGRNSFGVLSSANNGMWVRYWRTTFYPPDQGDVAKGTCSDGHSYTVTNCQPTKDKSVYC